MDFSHAIILGLRVGVAAVGDETVDVASNRKTSFWSTIGLGASEDDRHDIGVSELLTTLLRLRLYNLELL